MIPVLSLMVGLYIITKMVHLLADKHKEIGIVTGAFAVATIVVAIYAIYYCLSKGGELAQLFRQTL